MECTAFHSGLDGVPITIEAGTRRSREPSGTARWAMRPRRSEESRERFRPGLCGAAVDAEGGEEEEVLLRVQSS